MRDDGRIVGFVVHRKNRWYTHCHVSADCIIIDNFTRIFYIYIYIYYCRRGRERGRVYDAFVTHSIDDDRGNVLFALLWCTKYHIQAIT